MPTKPADSVTIQEAATIIRSGGLVAFPTETVYGLGADALNPVAVARIFEAKSRPLFDPLIVHVTGPEQLAVVAAEVPPPALTLIRQFWPGPLTLLLPKADAISGIVTAGLDTVAVRSPAHPVARALLDAAGTPLAAPSANRFGGLSPTRAEHVESQLGTTVDLILDGGPCDHGIESTIVAPTATTVTILRHGAIPRETLESFGYQTLESQADQAHPQAPGQLERHYAPRTPLVIGNPFNQNNRSSAASLTFTEAPTGYLATEVLSPSGDILEAAARLFDALHRLDAVGADVIYAEAVPEPGIGRAIMDRLRRAAAS